MAEYPVKVVLLNRSVYGSIANDDAYEGDKIQDLIAWLRDRLGDIPEEFRDSARIEIESVGGYEGEHHAEVTVYYHRPENDEERKRRVANGRARAEERERIAERNLAEARRLRQQLAKETDNT